MTVSPFDHPYLSGLFGDTEIASQFSAAAEIETMLAFETALAAVEAREGVIPLDASSRIADVLKHFSPDMPALREAIGRDGVVVPELVRQLRRAVGDANDRNVHFGATSQDVIDTSLMIRLSRIRAILDKRMRDLLSDLKHLEQLHGANRLMGRTRMQAAIAITVSDRLRAWSGPLERHADALLDCVFPVQFGGAAGTLDAMGDKEAAAVRAGLAAALDLADRPQWQSQRDTIAGFAGLLSLITGALGKIGQDAALLAQDGSEIALSGGGASSAMAHKQNPVHAEILVTLARFNATQLSGMHQALVHEQERSGSAWSLEWLLLPQMAVATGASLRLGKSLVGSILRMGNS